MKKKALMNILYIAFSIISGMASLYSALWGNIQSLLNRIILGFSGMIILIIIVLISIMIRPILRTNRRNIRLIDAIKASRLVDIEIRDEGDKHLPPSSIYEDEKLKEVIITGINISSTLQNNMDKIVGIIDQKKVYIIICDEKTIGIDEMSTIERRNVIAEIEHVKYIIKNDERIKNKKNFKMRSFKYLPSYTAIMVNGNIEDDTTFEYNDAYIRIQPRRMKLTHHNGVVFQFEKDKEESKCFDLFANDLREIWKTSTEFQ